MRGSSGGRRGSSTARGKRGSIESILEKRASDAEEDFASLRGAINSTTLCFLDDSIEAEFRKARNDPETLSRKFFVFWLLNAVISLAICVGFQEFPHGWVFVSSRPVVGPVNRAVCDRPNTTH